MKEKEEVKVPVKENGAENKAKAIAPILIKLSDKQKELLRTSVQTRQEWEEKLEFAKTNEKNVASLIFDANDIDETNVADVVVTADSTIMKVVLKKESIKEEIVEDK